MFWCGRIEIRLIGDEQSVNFELFCNFFYFLIEIRDASVKKKKKLVKEKLSS